jgi:hypothetical protein
VCLYITLISSFQSNTPEKREGQDPGETGKEQVFDFNEANIRKKVERNQSVPPMLRMFGPSPQNVEHKRTQSHLRNPSILKDVSYIPKPQNNPVGKARLSNSMTGNELNSLKKEVTFEGRNNKSMNKWESYDNKSFKFLKDLDSMKNVVQNMRKINKREKSLIKKECFRLFGTDIDDMKYGKTSNKSFSRNHFGSPPKKSDFNNSDALKGKLFV